MSQALMGEKPVSRHTNPYAVRRENFAPKNVSQLMAEDRDFLSEKNAKFQGTFALPPKMNRPPQSRISGGQFYSTTTNGEFFRNSGGRPASPFRPDRNSVATGKFEGQSAYSRQFQGAIAPVRRSMKPTLNANMETGPFHSNTTQRDEYQPWETRPAQICRPIHATEKVSENRTFQTENASHFNNKGIVARRSLKPKIDEAPAPIKFFEGRSTAADSFTGARGERIQQFRPEEAIKRDETDGRDWISENRKNYGRREYQAPRRAMKPAQQNLESGEFYSTTTNGANFPAWVGARPSDPIMPLPSSLTANTADPFDGSTAYSRQFTGAVAPVRRSLKPSNECIASAGPFESRTTNRDEFQPFNSRPAKPFLPTRNDNWYKNDPESQTYQTENGSKFNDKGIAVRRSLKPKVGSGENNGPFQGQSEARAKFVDYRFS
jgi:hypothetical protein